jgi:two-component system, LuxR family, response regulator FixJ
MISCNALARAHPAVICILDDDEPLLMALRRLLGGAGYAVETFSSARALLRFERLGETRCFLFDVHLSDGDGIALRESLLASGIRAPVVFMSGSFDARTRERALGAGALDYLDKPFDSGAVLSVIGKAFGPG